MQEELRKQKSRTQKTLNNVNSVKKKVEVEKMQLNWAKSVLLPIFKFLLEIMNLLNCLRMRVNRK